MKAAFGVEAIGLNAGNRITAHRMHLAREFKTLARPWLAEITGINVRYGLARTFMRPRLDYTNSNSVGSRGVWCYWTLTSDHVYETRYRTAWSLTSIKHRWITATDDGDITDMTEEEVWEWARRVSASTS